MPHLESKKAKPWPVFRQVVAQQIFKYELEEILIFLGLLALFLFWVLNTAEVPWEWGDLGSWYGNYLEPLTSLPTFILAFYIWYDRNKKEWKERLPKRLDIHFIYVKNLYEKDKAEEYFLALSCYKAHLIGEYDIRAYAQKIGQIMHGPPEEPKPLPLSPFYEVDDLGVARFKKMYAPSKKKPESKIKSSGLEMKNPFFKYYRINYFLEAPPDLEEKKYVAWRVNYSDPTDFDVQDPVELKAWNRGEPIPT